MHSHERVLVMTGFCVLLSVTFVWLCAYVVKNAATAGGQNTQAASRVENSEVKTSSDVSEPAGEWCEATTPEGYVYYWNTVTKGETLPLLLRFRFFARIFQSRSLYCPTAEHLLLL